MTLSQDFYLYAPLIYIKTLASLASPTLFLKYSQNFSQYRYSLLFTKATTSNSTSPTSVKAFHTFSLVYYSTDVSVSSQSQVVSASSANVLTSRLAYTLRHRQRQKRPSTTIMSATEQYMLLGGSNGLGSIGSVAYSTAAHRRQSSGNDDYQNYVNERDVHFRMIENQCGTVQAYEYQKAAALLKKSNEREAREEAVRRAVRKAKFNRKAIKNALINFGRTLFGLSSRKSTSPSAMTSQTDPTPKSSPRSSASGYHEKPDTGFAV